MTHRDLPTHIVAGWGTDRTLCGRKRYADEGLPYCGAHAVQAHIDGHGMECCPECLALWSGLPAEDRKAPHPPAMLLPEQPVQQALL